MATQPTPLFKQEIQQMMYIAGENQETSTQTVAMIEGIIRDQVVYMLRTANELAARRGSRVFSNDDLIFQIRHDTPRVERVRNFLAWKAIRKTVKDTDEKDALANEGFIDDEDVAQTEDTSTNRANVPSVNLPWDIGSFFSVQIPDSRRDDTVESATNKDTLEVLRRNDARTRDMTVEEYKTWSEYRHASFTWRKSKRFREWSGLGVIAEHKPNDDSLDILGYLTSEMVQRLTIKALEIQKADSLQQVDTANSQMTNSNEQQGTLDGLFLGPTSSSEEEERFVAWSNPEAQTAIE